MSNQNLDWQGVPLEFEQELTAEPEVLEQAICQQTS